MRRLRSFAAVFVVGLAAVVAVRWAVGERPAVSAAPAPPPVAVAEELPSPVDRVFVPRWQASGVTPAFPADDLLVLRRASLSLHGTVPSLEEIRNFEADRRPDRLRRRVRAMLVDPRFGDYFAERFARSWVGVSTEPFLIYRRDRFTRWLAEQVRSNRPYDDLVRAVLSTDGLWTSEPAANFVTSAGANDDIDENVLTARTVRAFLGQRIDCAQCHDHPFAAWKQAEFRGLAAFFGQSAVSLEGVVDQPRLFDKTLELRIDEPDGTVRVVAPGVPFLPECLPADGDRRDRLAAWVTDPRNERFARATVNRVWGLLFGRPLHEPVDDLPDPGDAATADLDVLATDFRASGHDLHRLIESIVLSRPFRLDSAIPSPDADSRRAMGEWAVFPITRLRPEQAIGAMIQAGRLTTIDREANLAARALRYFREADFVQEYGDPGEHELEPRSATVSQSLLRMNGKLTAELFGSNPFSATGRIVAFASDDERLVETCFLVTLTRRPTAEESAHFAGPFRGTTGKARERAAEDLLWSLVNSAEFSWNH